jgi:hypothetical protein
MASRYDKEIDALLNRLHSGCRFIDFEEDVGNRRGGGGGAGDDDARRRSIDVSNRLRNASPPDEAHADLGRGLARSYVGYVRSIIVSTSPLSSPSSSEDGNVQRQQQLAAERGERILQSLCCGSSVATTKNSGGMQPGMQPNYASTACAFFGGLISSFLVVRESEGDSSVAALLREQWRNWCVRCEELVLEEDGAPYDGGGGGGTHVLNACLKGYGHIAICHLGKRSSGADATAGTAGAAVSGGIARVYESLVHHPSRKYLIRTFVASAFTRRRSTTASNGGGCDEGGLVGDISPLFRSCVLRARGGATTTGKACHHAERELILRELLKACSARLHRASNEEGSISPSQIADMVRYLTSSLTSYLAQGINASFLKISHDGPAQIDLFELGHEWLGGICDVTMCLLSAGVTGDAADALSGSIEQIITVILPQFTPSSNAAIDMAPIYSSLVSCVDSIPRIKILGLANAAVTLRLGALALNLQDDAEATLMIDLISSVLRCLDDASDGGSTSRLFLGGMSSALGCVFRCRPACFDSATRLYELGKSLMGKAQCRKDEREHKEECNGMHLADIITLSIDGEEFPALMEIVTSSVSETRSIDRWQSRPLLLLDQCAGLLLGLSLLHMAIKVPHTSMQTCHALAFLRSLLQVYPRLASRAIPSIVDAARACLHSPSSMTQTLLGVLEFLSTPCIVFDPHGAQMAWAFLSSLAKEGVPTAVRSSVLRLLPGMCSSNKRLTRRVLDVIGMSMVAQ